MHTYVFVVADDSFSFCSDSVFGLNASYIVRSIQTKHGITHNAPAPVQTDAPAFGIRKPFFTNRTSDCRNMSALTKWHSVAEKERGENQCDATQRDAMTCDATLGTNT